MHGEVTIGSPVLLTFTVGKYIKDGQVSVSFNIQSVTVLADNDNINKVQGGVDRRLPFGVTLAHEDADVGVEEKGGEEESDSTMDDDDLV